MAVKGYYPLFSLFQLETLLQVVGGIVVATGVIPNPTSTGGDFMSVLAGHGSLLTILSILFDFINLGSVGTHCLYNGAVGCSHMAGKKMRPITLIIGVVGLVVAVSGIYNHFFNWLVLLGVIIPPIGAIIIMDRLVLRKNESANLVNWRPMAFIVWILSAAISLYCDFFAQHLSVAVVGLVTAVILYGVGSLFVKNGPTTNSNMKKVV
ncbi:hypothetical protein [Neobacillus niacini]|uniref:hypothetical protein n=1 Tax=Neobacillus niacini TaxID=86668 RepID=UPI002861E66F|nr:hypothetical protein [Neobacillus niacini]MDR7002555.1 purine-cytosine permease-like protein [Neobacillus niacini]